MRWLAGLLVAAAIAACAVVAVWAGTGSAGTSTAAPGVSVANVWVVEGAGPCSRAPNGVSLAASASPDRRCGSLAAAMTAASSGDTVRVEDRARLAGEQLRVSETGAKTLTVIGDGDARSRPSFGQVMTNVPNTTFRNLRFENRDKPAFCFGCGTDACSASDFVLMICAAHVTVEDSEVDSLRKGKAEGDASRLGGIAIAENADGFVLRSSEVHNQRDNQSIKGGADDILIEGNDIHDATSCSDGSGGCTTGNY